ncbi:RAD55 family ATPase [Halosimplex pelagicum]|uniref:HTR-like protein n=1 Tax=Halosimplex pelagicum TaxID=869886 RepID=A0A7D5PA50_9EURY|nr:HTR-like protein [Halosimplex pelagicum]QLH84483.1 HTR-like protein [Halosimplex pelagicum]
MDRIPFGVRQLDTTLGGGAPTGSVVLVAGEGGAGSREFIQTSTLLNALAETDEALHDLYYGDLAPNANPPGAVHFVSFTADERRFAEEVGMTMDDDIADAGMDAVRYHDLSEQYFHRSPVPRDWYAEETADIKDLRARQERDDILGELGELLVDHAPGNLVVIDSLSDLISTAGRDEKVNWSDVVFLIKGLQKGANEWNGVILVHVGRETVSDTEYGQLVDSVDGALEFEWASGGSTRARTLVVKQFRGVLSGIDDENIVQFETEVGDGGFDISDVRKIR